MRKPVLLLALLAPTAILACSKKDPPPPSPAPVIAPAIAPKKPHVPLTRSSEARDGSTIALAKIGERTVAYIADEDDSAIRVVDAKTLEVLSKTPLEGRPGQLIVDKLGRLIVTLRTDQSIAVLETTADAADPLEMTSKIATAGSEPVALAITPDDATLVVATGWGHSLEGYTLGERLANGDRSPFGARRFNVDLAREPRAVTVSSDGKTAFVAHSVASHMSAVPLSGNSDDSKATASANAENTIATNDAKKIDLGMAGWTEHRSRFGRANINPMLLFKVSSAELSSLGIQEPDFGMVDEPHFRCGVGMMGHEITLPSRVSRQGFAIAKISVSVPTTSKAKAKASSGGAKTGDATPELEERILMPHMAVATGDASVRSLGYGGGGLEEAEAVPTELFDIDVVDAKKAVRSTAFAVRSGSTRSGADACRLPRAAIVDQKHQRLFVSCLGVDRVMEYDASSAAPIVGFKRGIDVASGPTGLAIDEANEKMFVWSKFDRVVNRFSIAMPEPTVDAKAAKKAVKDAKPEPVTIEKVAFPAPSSPIAAEAALGEKLFHRAGNAKISKDGRACASCHPDGRDDGLVWSTPEGPRQTIMLAGRVDRELPFGWLGKHGSMKEHITVTMKNLKGTGASDEELNALSAWLRVMPSPPRTKNSTSLNTKAQHGKELFNSSQLQCGTCHAEKNGFSDHEAHDVASATGADVSRQFLVPSLRFVGGSGPYFHDGRYATLGELLQKNDKMGDTKSLSQDDRDALEAYLRTL